MRAHIVAELLRVGANDLVDELAALWERWGETVREARLLRGCARLGSMPPLRRGARTLWKWKVGIAEMPADAASSAASSTSILRKVESSCAAASCGNSNIGYCQYRMSDTPYCDTQEVSDQSYRV